MDEFLCHERLIIVYLSIINFKKKIQTQSVQQKSLITLVLHSHSFFDGLEG